VEFNAGHSLEDLIEFLKATRAFLLDYETWWRQPLEEVHRSVKAAQLDLHTLKTSCETILLNLGSAMEIDDMHFPDAWTAISYAASCFATSPELLQLSERLDSHEDVLPQVHQLELDFHAVQNALGRIMGTLALHEQRFTLIQPLFTMIKNLHTAVTTLQQSSNPTASIWKPHGW
jgi:hypothetical protein